MANTVWRSKKQGRKKAPKITEKQNIYALTKASTGSHKKALEEAGYNPTARPDLNKNVQYWIEKHTETVKRKFIDRAEEMADNMYELAKTAYSESVRFQATKDYLDRAGFAPVNKTEVEQKYINKDSRVSRELIERLNNLDKMDGSKKGD